MLSSLRLPDGGIYAFPWKTNPEMLMYNVDLLAAAGVEPPRTQSELLDAFRRLARDTDGDGRVDRWAMWATLKTTWFERFYDFYPLVPASSGGRTLVRDGEVMFDNDAAGGRDGGVAARIRRGDCCPSELRAGPGSVRRRNGGDEDHRPVVRAGAGRAQGRRACATTSCRCPRPTARMPDRSLRLRRSAEHRHLLDDASPRRRGAVRRLSHVPGRRSPADRGSQPAAVPARARVRSALPPSLRRWPTLATFATYVERTRDLDLDPDIVEIFDLISEAYEAAAIYGTVPVRQALRAAAEAQKDLVRAEERSGWLLAAPYAAFLLAFAAYPIVFALVLVFLRWDLVTAPSFAGLDNVRLLAQTRGSGARSRTPSSSSRFTCRSRSSWRWRSPSPSTVRSCCVRSGAAFFLPVVISGAVVAILWNSYATDVGLINRLLVTGLVAGTVAH